MAASINKMGFKTDTTPSYKTLAIRLIQFKSFLRFCFECE